MAVKRIYGTRFKIFGATLTKDTFLKDDAIKEAYENMVQQSGKEFADADIAYKIVGQGENV